MCYIIVCNTSVWYICTYTISVTLQCLDTILLFSVSFCFKLKCLLYIVWTLLYSCYVCNGNVCVYAVWYTCTHWWGDASLFTIFHCIKKVKYKFVSVRFTNIHVPYWLNECLKCLKFCYQLWPRYLRLLIDIWVYFFPVKVVRDINKGQTFNTVIFLKFVKMIMWSWVLWKVARSCTSYLITSSSLSYFLTFNLKPSTQNITHTRSYLPSFYNYRNVG